jgi:hypothetical protein
MGSPVGPSMKLIAKALDFANIDKSLGIYMFLLNLMVTV